MQQKNQDGSPKPEARRLLRSLQPERVAAAAGERVDDPAVVPRGARVRDLFLRRQALRRRDGDPVQAVPLLQAQIEVRAGGPADPPPLRPQHPPAAPPPTPLPPPPPR